MTDSGWVLSAQGRAIDASMVKKTIDEMNWDYPEPHLRAFSVTAGELDWMQHLNNVIWLRWIEETAWAHSEALGFSWDDYQQLGVAWVAHRHELDYLMAANEGDELLFATWITENDARLRTTREYQVNRISDGRTLLRGKTRWVCVDLQTGRPKRMPVQFKTAFIPTKSKKTDA